jgi:hypothetical protein
VKFELSSVAVGQLVVLALKPPIFTVIPLKLRTQTFLQSYAEDKDKRTMSVDIKKKAIFFLIRRALRKKLNFQPSKDQILLRLPAVTL